MQEYEDKNKINSIINELNNTKSKDLETKFAELVKTYSEDETTKEKIADISKGSTEWQIATTSISTEKPYESIEVGVRFNGHPNYSGTAYVASL